MAGLNPPVGVGHGAEFPVRETPGIALWPRHRRLGDSPQRGSRDAHTSVAVAQPWRATLQAVPHLCLADRGGRWRIRWFCPES
jgi:hypothetical protein